MKLDRPVILEDHDGTVGGPYFLRPILVRGKDGPLSASSRKGHLAALRELYRLVAVRYDFDRDPTLGVRSPKIVLKRGMVLTRSEIRAFLAADGPYPRCRCQAYLVVYTAGRASVFRHVLWSEVDLEAGTIHFSKAKHGRAYTLKLHPDLRRSRLEDGEALDAIAEVLNHRELSTTQNHYAFGSSARRSRAVVEFAL